GSCGSALWGPTEFLAGGFAGDALVDGEGVGERAVFFLGDFDGDRFDHASRGDGEGAAEEGFVGVVNGVEDAGGALFGDADVAVGEIVRVDHRTLIVAVADGVHRLLLLGRFGASAA